MPADALRISRTSDIVSTRPARWAGLHLRFHVPHPFPFPFRFLRLLSAATLAAASAALLAAGSARAECTDYAAGGTYRVHQVPTPHPATDVAVCGQCAYFASGYSGLQVIDLSGPSSPTIVGSWDNCYLAEGIVAADTLVYLADLANGLWIIDVADPTAPQQIGFFGTMNCEHVAIEGAIAYVTYFDTTSNSGVQVVDVSNPASPQLLGGIGIGGKPEAVAVSGGIVCMVNGTSLCVIDATVPSAPALLSSLNIPAQGVCMAGNAAYVAGGTSGLRIVDLSNPALPQVIGSVALPGSARDVAVSGPRAYVAADEHGFEEVDITEPTAPVLIREVPTIGSAGSVAMAGPLACVAVDWAGLCVIDTQDYPLDPVRVSLPGSADAVDVAGTIAYVGVSRPFLGGTGLYLVDISDPAAPSLRGVSLIGTDGVADVAASGGYAYVATVGDGLPLLCIVDVSNPDAPVRVGTAPIAYPPYGYPYVYQLVVSGGYVYVANGDAGLTVVRVTNPSAPVAVSQLAMPTTVCGVGVEGRYAFVLYEYGLAAVDVQNPVHPQIVSSVDTPGAAFGLEVQGGWAYVSGSFGLEMIDVRNPTAPQVVGQAVGFGGRRLACAGSFAYVLSSLGDLRVIDIADMAMTPVGYANVFQTPRAIAATTESVFIGDDTGLRILPMQCEPSDVESEMPAGAPGPLRILPNPGTAEMTIRFVLERAASTRLSIFDVAGRPVRRFLDAPLPAGDQSVRWDGRDDAGRPLPAGVYLTKLVTGTGTKTGRVVLIQ